MIKILEKNNLAREKALRSMIKVYYFVSLGLNNLAHKKLFQISSQIHNGQKRNQMLHLGYNCMVLVHLLVD